MVAVALWGLSEVKMKVEPGWCFKNEGTYGWGEIHERFIYLRIGRFCLPCQLYLEFLRLVTIAITSKTITTVMQTFAKTLFWNPDSERLRIIFAEVAPRIASRAAQLCYKDSSLAFYIAQAFSV